MKSHRLKGSAVLTLGIVLGATLLGYFGLLQEMWKYDVWYLSTIICAIGAFAYIHGLRSPRHSAKYAEVCVGMGLLGTIVGLSAGLSAVEYSGDTYDALKGAFVAFHTTITGLTWAMLLRVQHWIGGGEL